MGRIRKINAGIYKIVNIKNNKFYIGGSKYLNARKYQHFKAIKEKNHYNRLLQDDILLFNPEDFIFEVIEIIEDLNTLLIREQFYIDTLKPEYNICPIAGNSLNVKRTDEFKEKIRKLNTGLKHPAWRNELKSKSQGGENHWTKKKSFSEEAKLSMSLAQKKLYESGYIHPRSRIILRFDLNNNLIKEYKSLTEAAKEHLTPALIRACCNNQKENYQNSIWKWK